VPICRRRYNSTCDDGCAYDYEARSCLPHQLAGDPFALAEFLAQLYTYDMRAYGDCRSPALPYKQEFSSLCGGKRLKMCGTGAQQAAAGPALSSMCTAVTCAAAISIAGCTAASTAYSTTAP
jgi:hypothetical protein